MVAGGLHSGPATAWLARLPTNRGETRTLIRLAQQHPAWLLGFEHDVWWSRLARPAVHAWQQEDHPLRLVEQTVAPDDVW
jgi:hypothetical protein